MNTDTTSTTIDPESGAADAVDPLDAFASVLESAVSVVWGIDPSQGSLPTPCTDFDVAALVGHLSGAIKRAKGLADGGFGGDLDTSLSTEGTWADQIRIAGDDALAAWRSADLSTDRVLPWATLPGIDVLAIYTMEVAAHAWDLAVATRQPAEFDRAVGEAILAAAPRLVPDELPRGRAPGLPFDEAKVAPAGSGPYTLLAAFLGRSA